MILRCIFTLISIAVLPFLAYCDEEKATVSTDTVTDAAGALVDKTGALLSGNLDIEVVTKIDPHKYDDDYTTNAIGQRVPDSTALKAGGALHSEEDLD